MLPAPAPSNPVLAHGWCDCRVTQHHDRAEITGDKQGVQGWAESLEAYATKGEEMVEGQEPLQGGSSSFGGNTSRSGSCCLGKCLLGRGLVLCLNGSKSRISPGSPSLPAAQPGKRSGQRPPRHQACRGGQRDAAPSGGGRCSSVHCCVNPDRRLSLAFTAEAPSHTTPHVCTDVFARGNTSAEK